MLGMFVAKSIILGDRKATAPLRLQKWLVKMVSVLNLEKIGFNEAKFPKVWGPFLLHLHKRFDHIC